MKLYTHILCMCLTPKARAQTHWPMNIQHETLQNFEMADELEQT